MNLSYRLRTVASFVPEGSVVADIGTDHGYIPIYLCKEGKIELVKPGSRVFTK